jgi:hypothetical protein
MNEGKLYALSNILWDKYKKCGVTSQLVEKRVINIQTGNPENCNILYTTDNLLYPYYYERLLKKTLKEQRYNREFYIIEEEEIVKIYDDFNVMNKILNSEELILLYIKENDKEYYKKIMNKKIMKKKNINIEEKKIKHIYSREKRKKREVYYVNTES